MAPTLLWIGLGNMGRGMCKNLVEKGNLTSPLLIYNRSTSKSVEFAADLPASKAQVAESLNAAVSRADVIFSCVAHDEAVRELYNTMLQEKVDNKLFIDCSTIHPESTERVAADVIKAGGEFVAAPVFGAPAMADAGQLVAVLAGPKGSVEKAKPWFAGVTARAEIDLSDQPYSKATTLKVLGNTFIFNMVEQLAEAHVVAEKSGLGTEVLHQYISLMFPGPYTAYSTRMLTGDYHKRESPLFAIELARKDANHARDLIRSAGAQMQTLEIADAHFAKVKEQCGSGGDLAGVYGAVRKEAGLEFNNA